MKKDRSLAHVFLLTTLLVGLFIYGTELLRKGVTFDIFDYAILASVFVYPFAFHVANLITRNFGAKETVRAVLIAVVVQVLLFWLGYDAKDFPVVLSAITAFVVAQAAMLYVVEDLTHRESNKWTDWFMLYVLVFILDNIIYIALIANYQAVNVMTAPVLLSIIFKCIIAAILGVTQVLVLRRK